MERFSVRTRGRGSLGGVLVATAVSLLVPLGAFAQVSETRAAGESGQREQAPTTLAQQIQELRAKVLRLEQALKQKLQVKAVMPMGAKPKRSAAKTGSMDGMGMMGQRMMGGGKAGRMKKGRMSGMGSMAEEGTPKKERMKGMKMMGRMKVMRNMKSAEQLPVFPGLWGIYHFGAASFYLDHADKISLTPQQKTTLNEVKKEAMALQAAFEEKIDEAEEKLGLSTGSDQPDATKIEAQVRAVERLRGSQRMVFIRAVGRAAVVLTDSQRKMLTAQRATP